MSDAAQITLSAHSASELVEQVEARVISGALAPGQRLPSVRGLAAQLALSPATVAAGLAELRRRGVVITERRRGSRIGQGPPVGAHRVRLAAPAGVRDLSRGNPDGRLLPDLAAALQGLRPNARLYGEPPVSERLAGQARERLRADGVPAEGICVLSGALDAIDRVLQANLRAGDRVAVEDPGYVDLHDLLRAGGLQLEPVALDENGMLAHALAGALRAGAQAVVLTPRAQNPTGARLDHKRAAELRAVLAEHPDVLVVEDDHLGPVAGVALESCCGARERWAYTRSVAKALGPDLRLALLTGDPRTLARVQGRQQSGPGWVSHILQELVAALWADESVEQQVRDACVLYAERRAALLEALRQQGIEAVGASGLNVWIPVADEAGAVAGLLQRGFLVAAGAPFRLQSRQAAVRVTIATLEPAQSFELASALAEVLARSAGGRGA